MRGIIYKITNKYNGCVYIGQTIQSLMRRWKSHKSVLKRKIHHNEFLQRAYNKYGEEAFVIEEIENCEKSFLDERERYWIGYYDSTNRKKGYNFESGGNKLKKHSPETIEKFILSSRGMNNKLNPEQVEKIKKSIINGNTLTEIANEYNVSIHCIYRIKNLENWQYVAPELNEALYNTDTSRKIHDLSSIEIEECKKCILNGEVLSVLSKKYDIPYKRFINMFKLEIKTVRDKKKKINNMCKKLFFKNWKLKDILEKTGFTHKQYLTAIQGLEEKRLEKNIKYVGKAKLEGKTNTVIAKELNVNRCTVTVYWKEYKQKYADTVIT